MVCRKPGPKVCPLGGPTYDLSNGRADSLFASSWESNIDNQGFACPEADTG